MFSNFTCHKIIDLKIHWSFYKLYCSFVICGGPFLKSLVMGIEPLYSKQLWHSHEVDMMFYGAKKTHSDRGRRPRLIFVFCAP